MERVSEIEKGVLPMIRQELVLEIERLLKETHHSQRKLARLTGVSRSTIATIAAGKRPDYSQREQQRLSDFDVPSGPPARCPRCGGRVFMPCRLCHVRNLQARQQDLRQFRRRWQTSASLRFQSP
jgi:transcriptional regulator with XRE-family HTH domain